MGKSKEFIMPPKFYQKKPLLKQLVRVNKGIYQFQLKTKNCIRLFFRRRGFGINPNSLFKSVDIETNPICNRKCSFCPLSKDDSKKEMMSEEIFNKIVAELKELNYCGDVCLSSYGEPLLDPRLTSFAKKIKSEVGSRIVISTNGDFLTEEKLDELLSAGIDKIYVSQHDKEPSPAIKHLFSKINSTQAKHLVFQIVNENSELFNRGGSVAVKKMIQNPPFCDQIKYFYIRSDGNVRLCCNDYFNVVKLGNVKEEKLIDIWNKSFFKKVREELSKGIYNLKVCKMCQGIVSPKL